MKDTDNATNKLIKNIISLLVSVLVLIAATVAWFGVSTEANVDSVEAQIKNEEIDLKYFSAPVSTETLDWDGDDLVIRGEGTSSSTVSDYFSAVSSWTSTNSSLNISSLYPGEFRVYRVDFKASQASAVFSLMDVTSVSDADADDVFKSIYTFASATVNDDSTSAVSSSASSLFESLDGGNTARLLDISAQANDSVSVYYLIGIPGTDKNGTHDAIRQTGATVSVDTVGLDGNSVEEEPAAD